MYPSTFLVGGSTVEIVWGSGGLGGLELGINVSLLGRSNDKKWPASARYALANILSEDH